MQELFPLVAGALAGLIVMALPQKRLKVPLFVGLCVVFGFLASWLSGELEVSWGFLGVDMALVWAGACVAVVLVYCWRRLRTART